MDNATPNLPARTFAATSQFFEKLGFAEVWQDNGWMILDRNGLRLEFFPYPDLDPATSSFGACLRLDDVESFYATCRAAGIPEDATGFPRLSPPKRDRSGLVIGYLLDPDGSLLRLIQN